MAAIASGEMAAAKWRKRISETGIARQWQKAYRGNNVGESSGEKRSKRNGMAKASKRQSACMGENIG